MKILIILLTLFCPLAAQPIVVAVGNSVFQTGDVIGAKKATVTAELVFGDFGNVPNPGWTGRTVLVNRGEGPFVDKVKAVTAAGGVGVIIANNVAGEANDATLGEGYLATVPVVTVSQADGASLRTMTGQSVRIGPPQGPKELPDARTNAGKMLVSDGNTWIGAETPAVWGSASVRVSSTEGERLQFGVSANGSPPFAYQWSKDGVQIAGATNESLVINSVAPADGGTYTCLVSNSLGAASSGSIVVSLKTTL